MSDKEIIKRVFDKKINKDEIYKNVLDKSFKVKKINFLYVLAPICLVCLIYFSSNKIIINDINLLNARSINESYQVNEKKLNYYILENINIKNEFTLEANYTSNEKNIVIYSNNNEYIKLIFSKKNIIKELMTENDKISKINNKNINIYEYNNTFIALFVKENIYYNIETNTNKNDFLSLIKSIVK